MKRLLIALSLLSVMACQNRVNNAMDNPSKDVSKRNDWIGVSYSTYYNNRFGYKIDYPSVLNITNVPDNDDGRTFSYGGLTITVFGMYNASFSSVQEQFKMNQKPTDTYKVVKNNWYVRSGRNSNGYIYYEKSILKNDIWYTVILEYPESMKEELDDIVTKVVNSFKVL